jgi:hypothetical protein
MRNVLLIVVGSAVLTVGVSWAMYHATNHSALWSMAVGAVVLVVAAIALVLLAIYLTDHGFVGL